MRSGDPVTYMRRRSPNQLGHAYADAMDRNILLGKLIEYNLLGRIHIDALLAIYC